MPIERFCYSASVVHVVDGDTIDLLVDCGFNIHHKIRVRLYGVDTPESRTTNKIEKVAGLKAKEFATEWCKQYDTVLIQTLKDKNEKYGRVLAKIYGDQQQTDCLNERLIAGGWAKAYFGDKKEAYVAPDA